MPKRHGDITITATIELEVEADFSIEPGEKECRILPNGDPGYPGSGPIAELQSVGIWLGKSPKRRYAPIPIEALSKEVIDDLEDAALDALTHDENGRDEE